MHFLLEGNSNRSRQRLLCLWEEGSWSLVVASHGVVQLNTSPERSEDVEVIVGRKLLCGFVVVCRRGNWVCLSVLSLKLTR